jgi:hypothetical protein
MNYNVIFSGHNREQLLLIVKLFIISAKEADYSVSIESTLPENIFEPFYFNVYLKGSEKNSFQEVVVDFDDVLDNQKKDLSPSKLMINIDKNSVHYWYIFGSLFRRIDDLSTAFVTGYLLNQKKEIELKNFRSA